MAGPGVRLTDPRIATIRRYLDDLEKRLKKFAKSCPEEGAELLALFNQWKIHLNKSVSPYSGQDGHANAVSDGRNLRTDFFDNTQFSSRLFSHELFHMTPKNVDTLRYEGFREMMRGVPWAERSWEKPAIDFEGRIDECTCSK